MIAPERRTCESCGRTDEGVSGWRRVDLSAADLSSPARSRPPMPAGSVCDVCPDCVSRIERAEVAAVCATCLAPLGVSGLCWRCGREPIRPSMFLPVAS